MGKFMRFEGEFRVDDPDDNSSDVRKVFKESIASAECTAINVDLDPSTIDYAVIFAGGAGQTRKVFLTTDTEITVKLNGTGNTPFQVLSTTVIGGRIDSLYISTSLDTASIQVVATGL